MFASWGQP